MKLGRKSNFQWRTAPNNLCRYFPLNEVREEHNSSLSAGCA